MKPIQIFDYSVYAYNFAEKAKGSELLKHLPKLANFDHPLVTAKVKNYCQVSADDHLFQFYKANWALLFLRGANNLPMMPHIGIAVMDSKPYWRSTYYPEYKMGRKEKPDNFDLCRTVGQNVAKFLGVPCLSLPHYEADDLAAAIVRFQQLSKYSPDLKHWSEVPHILLSTVDSDWIQLVSPTVTWVNTHHWEPIIRNQKTSLEWVKKRLGVDLEHPQDIVPIKCIQGDKSDNLPAGTAPWMIDLMNPPTQHNPLDSAIFVQSLADMDFTQQEKRKLGNIEVISNSQQYLNDYANLINLCRIFENQL